MFFMFCLGAVPSNHISLLVIRSSHLVLNLCKFSEKQGNSSQTSQFLLLTSSVFFFHDVTHITWWLKMNIFQVPHSVHWWHFYHCLSILAISNLLGKACLDFKKGIHFFLNSGHQYILKNSLTSRTEQRPSELQDTSLD